MPEHRSYPDKDASVFVCRGQRSHNLLIPPGRSSSSRQARKAWPLLTSPGVGTVLLSKHLRRALERLGNAAGGRGLRGRRLGQNRAALGGSRIARLQRVRGVFRRRDRRCDRCSNRGKSSGACRHNNPRGVRGSPRPHRAYHGRRLFAGVRALQVGRVTVRHS